MLALEIDKSNGLQSDHYDAVERTRVRASDQKGTGHKSASGSTLQHQVPIESKFDRADDIQS
jgi:Zn-dependent membrane protease YugP